MHIVALMWVLLKVFNQTLGSPSDVEVRFVELAEPYVELLPESPELY
jgi:hypothetical protein